MKPLVAIDLCSGVGGWACAARGLPIRIALAVDHWDRACRTYKLNFPQTEVRCEDLRSPQTSRRILKDYGGRVDVILGGIPCEWLSVYRNISRGKGKVSEDEIARERQTLDSVLDLIRRLGPRWWCLEDVKQIRRELPPFVPWVEIDAADYSPQRRKRVYVGRFPLPPARADARTLARCLRPGPFRIGPRAFDRKPERTRTFTRTTCMGAWPDSKAPTMCAISSRRDAELVVVDPSLPCGKRQIEWQEAARLQGFPEDFVFYGSPTDVAGMVGRAIQIDTGRAILEAIVAEASSSA